MAEAKIALERIAADVLAATAQKLFDDYRIRIDRVEIAWLDHALVTRDSFSVRSVECQLYAGPPFPGPDEPER